VNAWDIYCHIMGDMQAGFVLGILLVLAFPPRKTTE
jgi:hypothetical protein